MDMKRTRYTPKQTVGKVRETDQILAQNILLAEVMQHLKIMPQTYQRWRSQYGAIRPEDMAWLKALGQENSGLRRRLAEKELNNEMLRMVTILDK